MIFNDTEKGRKSLEVALSDDEGVSWKWKRHLEKGEGEYHYPSMLEGDDGTVHVTYSYYDASGQTIKHAQFNLDWVRAGD